MNAGARLHRIHDRLAAQTTDQAMVQTWAEVFDLDKSNPHLEDEVANLVMALRSEIKFAHERLDAHGVPSGVVDRVAKVSDSLCKIKKVGEEAIAVGSAESALVLPYASKFLSGS